MKSREEKAFEILKVLLADAGAFKADSPKEFAQLAVCFVTSLEQRLKEVEQKEKME